MTSAATRRTAWALVVGQFALLAVIFSDPGPHLWATSAAARWALRSVAVLGLIPMAIAAVSLGRGLTAVPLPNARAELRTGGLYRLVRHPIYAGLLLAATAWAAATGGVSAIAAAAVLWALLNGKARWEEQRLAERFPDYRAYAATTPRFVPRPRRYGSPSPRTPHHGG